MKVAIYSRVSTDIQDFTKQTDELQAFAKINNYEVVYVFEEKISGLSKDRPEFDKLCQLTKDDIDMVLIWELSRLSRRSIYLQQTVKDFADKGICIYAKKEGLYTLDADGKENKNAMFIIGIIAMMAEQEVDTMKERTISSKQNKVIKQGNSYTSNEPFGYYINRDTKTLHIKEDEAVIVKRIFELSASGISAYRIPMVLNADGLTTKAGKKWSQSAIYTILDNSLYYGKVQYTTKSQKVDGTTRYIPIETVEIDVPAIITEELFKASKEAASNRTNRSKGVYTKYNPLLRGLIVCPLCGKGYTYCNRDKLYNCCTKTTAASPKCKSRSIKSNYLDIIIWSVVSQVFYKDILKSKVLETVEPLKEEVTKLNAQINGLEAQNKDLTNKAGVLVNTAVELKLQFPDMPQLYTNKLDEVKTLNDEAAKLNKEIEIRQVQINSITKKIDAAESSKDYVITEDTDKQEFLQKVVESIKIYAYGINSIITITFISGYEFNVYYINNKRTNRIDYLILDAGVYKFDNEQMVFTAKSLKPTTMKNFSLQPTEVRFTPNELKEQLINELNTLDKAAQ